MSRFSCHFFSYILLVLLRSGCFPSVPFSSRERIENTKNIWGLNKFKSIEHFYSRGQHLCKFIGTKERVCIRKEFNSHTGKNNGFSFLDIFGYLKNTHKNPKFGKVRPVPTREFPTKFPDWDLSHSSKFGIFVGIL